MGALGPVPPGLGAVRPYDPAVTLVNILLGEVGEERLYYTITGDGSAKKSELVAWLCRQYSDAIVCPPLEPTPRARLGRPCGCAARRSAGGVLNTGRHRTNPESANGCPRRRQRQRETQRDDRRGPDPGRPERSVRAVRRLRHLRRGVPNPPVPTLRGDTFTASYPYTWGLLPRSSPPPFSPSCAGSLPRGYAASHCGISGCGHNHLRTGSMAARGFGRAPQSPA